MHEYYFCIFLERHSKTFASGVSRYTPGRFGVIIKRVPQPGPCAFCNGTHKEDSKAVGQWGLYPMHQYYPDNCGPWALSVSSELETAKRNALGFFKVQVGPWSKCLGLKSLDAAIRYRYHGGSE